MFDVQEKDKQGELVPFNTYDAFLIRIGYRGSKFRTSQLLAIGAIDGRWLVFDHETGDVEFADEMMNKSSSCYQVQYMFSKYFQEVIPFADWRAA